MLWIRRQEALSVEAELQTGEVCMKLKAVTRIVRLDERVDECDNGVWMKVTRVALEQGATPDTLLASITG